MGKRDLGSEFLNVLEQQEREMEKLDRELAALRKLADAVGRVIHFENPDHPDYYDLLMQMQFAYGEWKAVANG